jgi:hypothetical protein
MKSKRSGYARLTRDRQGVRAANVARFCQDALRIC